MTDLDTAPVRSDVEIRLLTPTDADPLGELYQQNLHLFSLDEPGRDRSFFTADGQRTSIENALRQAEADRLWPGAIVVGGAIAGKVTLYNIQRGHLLVCSLGIWVGTAFQNVGVATSASVQTLRVAFDQLGLHKIDAYTKPDNVTAQRLLERLGFTRVGTLARHIYDRGRWWDQAYYELVAPWCDGSTFTAARNGEAGA